MSEAKRWLSRVLVPESVRAGVCRWMWPDCMGLGVLAVLTGSLPWGAKGLAVVSVGGWWVLGKRAGVLPPVLLVMLAGMGRVEAFGGQTAILGAMVLGLGALWLRLERRGRVEAVAAGVLWAGMGLCEPGLAPLAVLGLLALAAMQEAYGRSLVYAGWGLLLAGLGWAVWQEGAVPAALLRPVDAGTYEELVALGREWFAVERLWRVIPLVGLLELAQGMPQDGRQGRRNLPVFGGLLCVLFLPVETLRGAVWTLGLPVSSVMLSRWVLAVPAVRAVCASRLKPTKNPLPDNVWMTSLTTVLAGLFLWGNWVKGAELFRSGEAVTRVEALLLEGEGHPLTLGLAELGAVTDFGPFFWNRLVSGVFLAASAWMLVRLVKRSAGLPLGLCAGILFLSVPGLAVRLATAGGGAVALWFFLKGFSSVSKENVLRSWLRGGVYAGVAFWLDPVWLLPAAGLAAGVWEVHRARFGRVMTGLGIAVAGGAVLSLVLPGGMIPGVLPPEGRLADVEGLLWGRYGFLALGSLVVLGVGAMRRGMGWWVMALSVPGIWLANRWGVDAAAGWVPLVVLGCMAFVRVPGMLDVRHPSVYQTVLDCQLLLWVPVLMGTQSAAWFL